MYKVLLVDDELSLLERIKRNMDWEGLELRLIDCCGNAIDALERMVEDPPDILVTDIKMPVMDGLELISRAKEINPAIQCVILSAYGEFSLAQMAIELGAVSYLLKPFSKEDFIKALTKCKNFIREEESAQSMKFKQRSLQEMKLAQELLEDIKGRKASADALMVSYPDTRLLRDADIFLLIKYVDSIKDRNMYLQRMIEAKEDADIYELTASLLNQLWKGNSNESTLIRQMKEYTQQHYMDDNLNLQMLANEVIHLGVKYLGRCFQREVGCRYSEYLTQIRMEKAMDMIDRHDTEIKEVARQVGLGEDVSYFYQLFKKYTGKTPGQYRKGK